MHCRASRGSACFFARVIERVPPVTSAGLQSRAGELLQLRNSQILSEEVYHR
jgi:hypothetical protein